MSDYENLMSAATFKGSAPTFTATYTFPPGAVEAAKACCKFAGLTVIDTTDEATITLIDDAIYYWTGERDLELAENISAALRADGV